MTLLEKGLKKLRRLGPAKALHLAAVRLANLAVDFKILRGVCAERPDPAFLLCPESYRAGFLPPELLRAFAERPETEMSPQFVEQTAAKGDECFAICDGDTLAAYGWYSTQPTPTGTPGMLLHFSGAYVYMYKGFTDTRYRGQRLHAIGMTLALQHYLGRGYRGLVSYVESTNFDSLKSCFRMGYRQFGSVYMLRIFGRTLAWSSPGCAPFSFRVERSPGARPVDLTLGKT